MALGRKTMTLTALAVVGVVVVAGLAVLLSSGNDSDQDSGRLNVVASFYPLYYFSSEIGKDMADVSMLIPDNSEPHSWEPSPSDILKINRADVLVYNGEGFEPWIETVLGSLDNGGIRLVDTSKNVSLLLSHVISEAYDQAVDNLSDGIDLSISASADQVSMTRVEGEGHYSIALAPMASGNGGYIKIAPTTSGEFRLFVTNVTDFSVTAPNGDEMDYELERGTVTSYPMFTNAKFMELEAGMEYVLFFEPGNATDTSLVITMDGDEGENEHEHGLNDPHFWLDPLSAKVQVMNIVETFKAADPLNATAYQQNADDLLSRLDVLDQEYKDGLANRTKNAIVTTHEGFNYLAQRYGFEAYAAVGISADAEPSAGDLVALSNKVRELGLRYVFSQPIFSDNVINTIAEETGATVLVLDTVHGRTGVHSGMDYFEIMRANLEALKTGLEVPT